jgi:RHS repeat-associated protein
LTTFTNGATTATLTYDADGNRTKKVVGATTTWYLVAAVNPTGYPQVVEEHTGASPGTLSRRYTYGLDLISQTVGSTTRFFGTDGLGSTRFLLDTSGTLTEHYGYDAYGTIIVSNAAPSTVYLFAGEQWDPDLGLYYNRARYLNVGLGRFWNYDSFEGSPTDPLSLHKYLYCHANPVSGIDPSGRFEITQTMVTCTIITSLAVITADVAIHKYGGTGYNLTQADLTDPKQPYRAIIIKAARDNRLEPEFVAAIILAELNALWIEDYTTDIPGAIIGDASIGIGQIKPSTVAILRPDFGRGRRVWAAFRPKTAIPLVAEYLRAVADSGVEEPVENFWYSGHQLAMRDFQQDGSTWSWPMEVVMAYNYTQSAWNIRDNPQNGRQEFTERRRAGQYGDWVLQKRRELRGKFN